MKAAASSSAAAARAWFSPANLDARAMALVVLAFAASTVAATAAAGPGAEPVYRTILRWAPLLLSGFVFNIAMSLAAMVAGTLAGTLLGLAQLARRPLISRLARFVTQLFRNSPWLVLLFLCMFLIPFEIRIAGLRIPFPDWAKAILGFSLPVMANVSEIVRGAVLSVPRGQWEASTALGLRPRQAYRLVILPQCVKRMLPPWMNLYSLIIMSTVTASVVGVSEMLTLTSQALAAEGSRPELLAPFYAFAMVCFFLYCYPIGRLTLYLERRNQLEGA